MVKYTTILLLFLGLLQCTAQESQTIAKAPNASNTTANTASIPAANNPESYLPKLQGKKIGLVANHTSIVEQDSRQHLVDFLLSHNIQITAIFAPEHGFRGTADAGEHIKDGKDAKTGIPLISLYGNNKKPTPAQLKNIDILLFDIQDVGARFYTYISTLHYVMEAGAENNIPVIVLDRPNPNGHYIDGPVLEPAYKSFVGMHKVPIVYGMSIGEYAEMINGEKWLKNQAQAQLTVIPMRHYQRQEIYSLPVKPSPNLPNDQSINLYPSLCFFEGTNVNEGRGTSWQFQVYGSPHLTNMPFSFTPQPNEGAKSPKHQGKKCHGEDLRNHPELSSIDLQWLIKAYQNNTQKPFFTPTKNDFFFDKLAGNSKLRKQIEQGLSAEEIRATWQADIEKFKKVRAKYLLYADF
ncbi:MAG: DUF1343 domain-containing protein [Weeksellaceae bacterium]|nr:DUF1343 domain-containing protein [Weeksellaceae bacterium]